MSHSLGEVTDVVVNRGADLKIILGLAVWMLSSGIAYLVGDIAFSSDIYKYMEPANLMMLCVIGGLVIAAVYSCWYLLRKEKRLTDILVPTLRKDPPWRPFAARKGPARKRLLPCRTCPKKAALHRRKRYDI